MTRSAIALGLLVLAIGGGACAEERPSGGAATAGRAGSGTSSDAVLALSPSGQRRDASAAGTGASVASSGGLAAGAPSGPSLALGELRRLARELSEPDSEFFSDNYTSNETSYLQVAAQLGALVRPGGVYLGVGPEQNFTYIALTRPAFAYLIDIRRDNLLLHLLYKAIFDVARSRAHFLTLLTARAYDEATDPGPQATIAEVMAHAERHGPSAEDFPRIHDQLLARIARAYGFALDEADRRALVRTHRAFAKGGLDLRFSLKEQSFRRYPSLRELFAERDPAGKQLGFLASEESFRFVQEMQREHRIVPLVGDFAGDRALPRLARHLSERGETVSAFYVSNVEQYLMVGGVWWKWQRNVAALPTDDRSVFIRAFLDQGTPHPAQLKGHRTATVVQHIAAFKSRKRPYPSMLALATDGTL